MRSQITIDARQVPRIFFWDDKYDLDQIGKDAFQPISSFALQEVPTPDSITVMVNDELCGVGWVWSEAENTIVFDQAIPDCFPGPNASISVTYEPVCWPPVGQ